MYNRGLYNRLHYDKIRFLDTGTIYITGAALGEIAAAVRLGDDLEIIGSALGEILASVEATVVLEDILTFNATIPPGGVLVIDTDNFNVLLNGNDAAIKDLEGIWFTISRETQDIRLVEDAEGIDMEMLYTELYL